MISSEVQRTLVKSPPELWAELSDPASLARHLGELGEIRITRVEPERTVEWEATDTTGKVLLKASGWGTKVTLTVAREVAVAIAEPEPAIAPETASEASAGSEVASESRPATEPEAANVLGGETEPEGESAAAAEPEPATAVEPDPVASTDPESHPEVAAAEPEPEAEAGVEKPAKRPGFFARLFGRRPKEQAPPEPIEAPESTTEPAPAEEPKLVEEPKPTAQPEPEPESIVAPQPPHEQQAAPQEDAPQEAAPQEAAPQEIAPQDAPKEDTQPADVPDIAAELRSAEEAATAEVTAVLTAVLDRLGAAHHRPFSRS
jgi:hypothetical protein